MENFTPMSGFVGGAMIGLSAALSILILGRVAGISGILGGVLGAGRGETGWRVAFLAGLVVGPLLLISRGVTPEVELQASWPVLILAGLLVGFGTRLGGGCTSGHGVCGIARGAPRSIWATATFFATAALTIFVIRHLFGA